MLIHIFIACSHVFLTKLFRPDTGLDIYTGLTDPIASKSGPISQNSAHELSWTVLDLNRGPPAERCCNHCNTHFLDWCRPSNSRDPRILKYASEFIHSLPPPPSRPSSPTSVISDSATVASQDSVDFEPVKGKQSVSKEDKAALHELLVTWRKDRHFRMGNSPYIPCEVILPPKQLEKLVASSGTFLTHTLVEPKHIQKAVTWDMAPDSAIAEVCDIISRWRLTLDIRRTPQSARRPKKRTQHNAVAVIPQPVFTPPPFATPQFNRSPRGRGRGRARGATPHSALSMRPLSALATSSPVPVPTQTPFQTPTSRYDDFFSSISASRTFNPTPLRFPPPSHLAAGPSTPQTQFSAGPSTSRSQFYAGTRPLSHLQFHAGAGPSQSQF
jgi:hypothetical protein